LKASSREPGYAVAGLACIKIPFSSLPFTQGGHPFERKKTGSEPSVSLLEFRPGFADPNWCRRAHVIYVLRGALTLELEGVSETVAEGEGCVLDAGTAHRARNDGAEPVLAFIASDLKPADR
jgi:quercetin dioxygenase-like cupin family protein